MKQTKTLFILFFILVLLSSYASAGEDNGKYWIQLASCTSEQSALDNQKTISTHPCLIGIANLGYSTTISITTKITADKSWYVVQIGNYPTFGEARYVARELARNGWNGLIKSPPTQIPDVSSITGTADEIFSQSTAFSKAKQYTLATVYYTAFLKQYPNDRRYYTVMLRLGYASSHLKNRQGALQAFQTVANSTSNLAEEALLRVGYTYLAINELDNAKNKFQTFVTKYPKSQFIEEANTQLNNFIVSSAGDDLLKNATIANNSKNYAQATAYLTQYIQNYPKGSRLDEAYLKLGMNSAKAGDQKTAFQSYQQILKHPENKYTKDACVLLGSLALDFGSTYVDSAIETLKQSPSLTISNQTIGGLLQTYIGYLYLHGKVPKAPGGKISASFSDQSICQEAITECRKVRELYPNANRRDLARSSLMEVEAFCRLYDENTVISLASTLIVNYFDQSGYCCYAQFRIGASYEKQSDYQNALQAYQAVLNNYTNANNITNLDDIIALTLFRKAACLEKLGQNYDAITTLQEIIQNHSNSGFIVVAKKELDTLHQGVIILTDNDMRQIYGSSEQEITALTDEDMKEIHGSAGACDCGCPTEGCTCTNEHYCYNNAGEDCGLPCCSCIYCALKYKYRHQIQTQCPSHCTWKGCPGGTCNCISSEQLRQCGCGGNHCGCGYGCNNPSASGTAFDCGWKAGDATNTKHCSCSNSHDNCHCCSVNCGTCGGTKSCECLGIGISCGCPSYCKEMESCPSCNNVVKECSAPNCGNNCPGDYKTINPNNACKWCVYSNQPRKCTGGKDCSQTDVCGFPNCTDDPEPKCENVSGNCRQDHGFKYCSRQTKDDHAAKCGGGQGGHTGCSHGCWDDFTDLAMTCCNQKAGELGSGSAYACSGYTRTGYSSKCSDPPNYLGRQYDFNFACSLGGCVCGGNDAADLIRNCACAYDDNTKPCYTAAAAGNPSLRYRCRECNGIGGDPPDPDYPTCPTFTTCQGRYKKSTTNHHINQTCP